MTQSGGHLIQVTGQNGGDDVRPLMKDEASKMHVSSHVQNLVTLDTLEMQSSRC